MVIFRTDASTGADAREAPLAPELPLDERLQLTEEAVAHLCGPRPWLVVHKLEPDWTRLVGRHVATCTSARASQTASEGS